MPYFLEKLESKKELKSQHVLIGEIKDTGKSGGIYTFIIKAILIFLASYSTIAGLLDAFEVPYLKYVIVLFFLVFSFIVSFMYLNKVFFYVGYVIMFLAYTIELARYFFYANSGFQAVVNIIYEKYSDFYGLSSIRQAQELYTNRQITVTFAAVFVGLFLIILLNITISGYMNVIETFVITFPFLEIAFYIGKKPPLIYTVTILFVYASVALLQASRFSRTQVKGRHTHEFARIKRKNKQLYFYQANTRIFLIALSMSAVISLAGGFVFSNTYYRENARKPQNMIHKQTDEFIKIFIQTGIAGLLNGYSSTGGLAGGKLGGISQVRPDFETDLTVTYVPINFETVYLKGFTGSMYSNDIWTDSSIKYDNSGNILDLYTYESIEKIENERDPIVQNKGKMLIENIDANPAFIYRPYFTDTDSEDNLSSVSNYFTNPYSVYELYYSPSLNDDDFKDFREDTLLESNEYYYNYVYDACTYVPEDLKNVLDDTINNIDLPEYSDSSQYRLDTAKAVYNYFWDNFYYTMSPGSTPSRRDFVEYFLTDQKRGYCAHFSTATVLLLRELGIPARYCEGYCIPLSLVYDNGVIVDEKYSDWYSGSQIFGAETVLSVDVNDSYAHAWVEIYLDGYGFVPFEATIPSFGEESVTYLNFSDLFSSIMSNTFPVDADGNTPADAANFNTDTNFDFFKTFAKFNPSSAGNLTIYIFTIFFGIILLILFIKWIKIRIKLLNYKLHHDEYNLAKYDYDKIIKKMKRKKYISKQNPLMSDVKTAYEEYINSYNSAHKKKITVNTEELFSYYERILYS